MRFMGSGLAALFVCVRPAAVVAEQGVSCCRSSGIA
jgi:hypothetical protein